MHYILVAALFFSNSFQPPPLPPPFTTSPPVFGHLAPVVVVSLSSRLSGLRGDRIQQL